MAQELAAALQAVRRDLSTAPDDAVAPRTPLPLSDAYDHDWMDQPAPADTMQIWGHCTDFCESSDSRQTSGLTIAEHGLQCRSLPTVWINATNAVGGSVLVSTPVAQGYAHGTYRRSDAPALRRRSTAVELALSGSGIDPDEVGYEVKYLTLTVGDARRLAAGLIRAAEVADRMDRDFLGATSRRRGAGG